MKDYFKNIPPLIEASGILSVCGFLTIVIPLIIVADIYRLPKHAGAVVMMTATPFAGIFFLCAIGCFLGWIIGAIYRAMFIKQN